MHGNLLVFSKSNIKRPLESLVVFPSSLFHFRLFFPFINSPLTIWYRFQITSIQLLSLHFPNHTKRFHSMHIVNKNIFLFFDDSHAIVLMFMLWYSWLIYWCIDIAPTRVSQHNISNIFASIYTQFSINKFDSCESHSERECIKAKWFQWNFACLLYH